VALNSMIWSSEAETEDSGATVAERA
jgi:hypothetical protein